MDFLVHLTSMVADMLGDWPLGTVIGIVFVVGLLLVVILVAYGLFVAVDSWFMPRNSKVGRVVGKIFTPAHTQTIMLYNAATKSNMPHVIFIPDHWSVSVEVDGQQDGVSVSEEFFDSLSQNDSVLTEYVSGRFSGGLYIKTLSLV